MTAKLWLVGCVLAAVCCGCSRRGPELCEVEGVVTLDGQPLANVQLTFIPQDVPVTMISYGRTDDQGRYKLDFTATKSGAIPAFHHVRVEMDEGSGQVRLPSKYRVDEALTADVKEGRNVINLELTSK